MISKFDAVLSDLAQFRERENLISAAIRQNWSIPIHEFVQAAKMFDHIQSRPNKQVIGISKNDLRLKFMQLSRRDGFHRPLRPYRHKRRCLDYAVHCSYSPTSRFRLSILRKKLEHCASVSHNGSGAHAARSRRNCLSWETIFSKQGETR